MQLSLNETIIFLSWLAGSLVVGFLIQLIIKGIAKSKKFESITTDEVGIRSITKVLFNSISRPIPFLFLVIGLKISFSFLELNPTLTLLIADVLSVLLIISIGFFIYCLVDVVDYLMTELTKKTATTLDDMVVPMVRKSLRVIIFILILVQIAQVLSDKPITSILAGLGVGGLAIALAAQETIRNFFGSLLIFTDKPFELDELIAVEDFLGVVEEVGFRSTRIRTLDGHLVTIPNGELSSKMIENIGKRPYIKRVLELGVTYDTSLEKMEEAKNILTKILDNHEGMHSDFPPRVFFKSFDSSSLGIIVFYWYHPGDYWAYMKHADFVNTEILKHFNDAGIEFAFPTRTLHINDPRYEEFVSKK